MCKTIANLIATNFLGGPEKQILAQSMHLNREYFNPVVISYKEGTIPNNFLETAQSLCLTTRTLETRNPFNPKVINDLCHIIQKDGIDMLCAHGYKSNIIGRFATWKAKIPFIAISRGWTSENSKIRLYEKLDKLFLHFADHIVAVSQGQKAKIINLGIPEQRINVIHNAINLAKTPAPLTQPLRRQLGLPDNALIVASSGRLSPEKNYAGMIEVAREVIKHNSKVHFVIFGEGFLRPELENKISLAELDGRFLLPGFRNDLQAALHEIDIFMLPSFTEGLPNVILEAFAVRKPVVATAVGGTPEVVEDGVSGFLTHPHETEKMAQYVLRLVGDPVLRQQMGDKGFEQVKTHFSFEQQTQLYEELYVKIAGSIRSTVYS